jgi:hypothetical protein
MAKYFDEALWREVVKKPDWYLVLGPNLKKLMTRALWSKATTKEEIRSEVYSFFIKNLESGQVFLAESGPNWDKERKTIDTIVIHHTSHSPGVTWQQIDAVHLLRLYANYYSSPYDNRDKSIKGQPIFSNHFRSGRQVFYAYHWLVRNDGSTERLLNDNEVGWQAGNWEVNCKSVAICLDNDYENSSPSDVVIAAVARLIKANYSAVKPENILGHRQVNPKTTCPGSQFLNGWKKDLINSLNNA